MPTLTEKAYALTQRATADLRINGVRITNWISMRGGDSEDNPVPYLDVELPDYSIYQRGMNVTLEAGYDNDHLRMFTGGLFAKGDEDPDALRTQCFVRGATNEDGTTIEALASIINPPVVWPRIPTGQYIDFEVSDSLIWELDNAGEIASNELQNQATIPRRPSGNPLEQTVHALGDLKGAFRSYKIPARDLSGQMLKAAMSSVFDDSGIASYILDFDDYQLAPIGGLIDRAPGSQTLSLLMTLKQLTMRQLRSGTVHVSRLDPRPSIAAIFAYKSSDPDFARLIDNPGVVRVPFNPDLQRGMTIEIEDEVTQVSGLWYLRGHEWELGPTGDWSYMDLIGGKGFGVAIGINPTASFGYFVDLEYQGGVLTATVQFDAQTSFDNDGVLVDADISWDDNQTPNLISGTGFRKSVTVAVADIVEPWIVTATATDADELTGQDAQTIDTSFAGSAVQLPAIGVAAESYGLFSPDSAGTWDDHAESTQTAVGLRPSDGVHFGHALYGYLDGHVELTRDGNVTRIAISSLTGDSEITFIAWDWRNTLVAWVLTDQLELWVCINMDAVIPVFGLYGGQSLRVTLGLSGGLGRIIGLPFGGAVYVIGGTGTGYPLTAYDALGDNHWVVVSLLGDIITDGPGAADLAIADFALGDGLGDECFILENAGGRANGSIAIYHTSDIPGPTRTWSRVTGLPAGLVDGRAMLGNGPLALIKYIAIFGDAGSEDSVFKSEDGITFVETTGIIPSGKVVNHAMWLADVLTGLPAFDGIYVFALGTIVAGTGGIYKSVDECSTELIVLRDSASADPMPINSQALQLSIGASIETIGGLATLYIITQSGKRTYRVIPPSTNWERVENVTGSGSLKKLRFMHDALWRINNIGAIEEGIQSVGQMERSMDGGITWVSIGPAPILDAGSNWWGAQSYDFAADGRLWVQYTTETVSNAADVLGVFVYRCDDPLSASPTFTQVDEYSVLEGGWAAAGVAISCHPTNFSRVATCILRLFSADLVRYTITGQLSTPTFIQVSCDTGFDATPAVQLSMMADSSLILIKNSSNTQFWKSINWGANWIASSETYGFGTYNRLWYGRATTAGLQFAVTLNSSTGGHQVWRTLDFGESWIRILNNAGGSNQHVRSLYYDEEEDSVYLGFVKSGDNIKVSRIDSASTVGADAGTETDLTGNLNTAFQAGSVMGIVVGRAQ